MRRRIATSALLATSVAFFAAGTEQAAAQSSRSFEAARNRMVDEEIVAAGVTNPTVIRAMRTVPRHEHIPARYKPHDPRMNYWDMGLPIGESQTISSPFIVAFMTEALDPQPTDRVLEIGTGSGYQAAVLSHCVKEVYTIEIVETLGKWAAKVLADYPNVKSKIGRRLPRLARVCTVRQDSLSPAPPRWFRQDSSNNSRTVDG